ncbi:hypothetical protein IE53DRAFT_371801 [Violaceomyces palustris]|uniref:Uncharacterized protein n=1 Tax=Violaceomyces palustris TaxID=1673888 RepID=A0ACD0NMQ3_9BASI|nr:hypothetical protein IE53DRAFT_371801 [Violaceomyces palustris]
MGGQPYEDMLGEHAEFARFLLSQIPAVEEDDEANLQRAQVMLAPSSTPVLEVDSNLSKNLLDTPLGAPWSSSFSDISLETIIGSALSTDGNSLGVPSLSSTPLVGHPSTSPEFIPFYFGESQEIVTEANFNYNALNHFLELPLEEKSDTGFTFLEPHSEERSLDEVDQTLPSNVEPVFHPQPTSLKPSALVTPLVPTRTPSRRQSSASPFQQDCLSRLGSSQESRKTCYPAHQKIGLGFEDYSFFENVYASAMESDKSFSGDSCQDYMELGPATNLSHVQASIHPKINEPSIQDRSPHTIPTSSIRFSMEFFDSSQGGYSSSSSNSSLLDTMSPFPYNASKADFSNFVKPSTINASGNISQLSGLPFPGYGTSLIQGSVSGSSRGASSEPSTSDSSGPIVSPLVMEEVQKPMKRAATPLLEAGDPHRPRKKSKGNGRYQSSSLPVFCSLGQNTPSPPVLIGHRQAFSPPPAYDRYGTELTLLPEHAPIVAASPSPPVDDGPHTPPEDDLSFAQLPSVFRQYPFGNRPSIIEPRWQYYTDLPDVPALPQYLKRVKSQANGHQRRISPNEFLLEVCETHEPGCVKVDGGVAALVRGLLLCRHVKTITLAELEECKKNNPYKDFTCTLLHATRLDDAMFERPRDIGDNVESTRKFGWTCMHPGESEEPKKTVFRSEKAKQEEDERIKMTIERNKHLEKVISSASSLGGPMKFVLDAPDQTSKEDCQQCKKKGLTCDRTKPKCDQCADESIKCTYAKKGGQSKRNRGQDDGSDSDGGDDTNADFTVLENLPNAKRVGRRGESIEITSSPRKKSERGSSRISKMPKATGSDKGRKKTKG